MKKTITGIVTMVIVLLSVGASLASCVSVTNQTVFVSPSVENRPLIIQDQANLWLGCWEGWVYVYPVYHPLTFGATAQYLSRLEPGRLRKISKLMVAGETFLDVTTIAGQIGSELYFFSTADDKCSLYMMNIDTGKTETVWNGQQRISRNDMFINNGELWLRLFDNGIQGDYLLVKEGNARVVSNALRPYYLGEKEYVLNYEPGYDPCLLMRERGGEWQDTGLDCGNKCTLIPTQYGLVVHCSGYSKGGKQHLYLIQPTGEAVELLTFPCLYSVSAINIFDEKLYYSMKRYEKYGEIGMTRYENDEVEGSYIINLTDLSAEKVSNMIFDGLYIFDDSGIIACDENCNIYKLDYKGNVTDVLLEIK